MPSKKKIKLTKGQQRLGITSTTSRLEFWPTLIMVIPTILSNHPAVAQRWSPRPGVCLSPLAIGRALQLHGGHWVSLNGRTVWDDGIYYKYCSHSGSYYGMFISKPYTGNRPDKLVRHGLCVTHIHNQLMYQENSYQLNSCMHGKKKYWLTVDEHAFLWCYALYVLPQLKRNCSWVIPSEFNTKNGHPSQISLKLCMYIVGVEIFNCNNI